MTQYDCMTADELELWRRPSVRQGGRTPCVDCPVAFRLAEIAAGRCHRLPPVEILPERRDRNREWMREYRARATA